MIMLEESPVDWAEAEQFWIDYLRSMGARLTNLAKGGVGAYVRTAREPKKRRPDVVPKELLNRTMLAMGKVTLKQPQEKRLESWHALQKLLDYLLARLGPIGGREIFVAFLRKHCWHC